ncbi:WD repeat protein [Calycina marina]|uniref:WD repeat protein n=1 Tax=Calycina marina TaxID=1763456 RepID=A0A9P7Z8N5_9HELO|nr:WD repeat protein [Calycina marina]
MAEKALNSNQVNLIIWQYLISIDYRETAVHLMKEWNTPEPQELPIFPHVPKHALVRLLQYGLQYDAALKEYESMATGVAKPAHGFFGPVTNSRPVAPIVSEIRQEELENARKHQIEEDQVTQQNAPSKRPRLSNGYENGSTEPTSTTKSPTAMDLDEEPAPQNQHGNGNAYPSPEQLPSPVMATFGPDRGTQVDKVSDLGPAMHYFNLSDNSLSVTRNSVILHCEFNPQDSCLLAAAGTDALGRVWRIPTKTDGLGVTAAYCSLLEENLPTNTTTSCMTWKQDGTCIALATEGINSDKARIQVRGKDGALWASIESFFAPVFLLKWNEFGSEVLLVISTLTGNIGALVEVVEPRTGRICRLPLPNHDLADQPLDAAWVNSRKFVVCGGDFLQRFEFHDDQSISADFKYNTKQGHGLTNVIYNASSSLLATSSELGTIDLWDEQGNVQTVNAHQGAVTALVWQPPTSASNNNNEQLLASAGDDGAINIWNTRQFAKPHKSMTMDSGVVALAFKPCGQYLAGASNSQVLIWNVLKPNLPCARWSHTTKPGWQTPKSNYSEIADDQYSLSWSPEGYKLAYAVNGTLATIGFRDD